MVDPASLLMIGSIGGGLIGGLGSMFGSDKAADASKDAAEAQQFASMLAMMQQQQAVKRATGQLSPYIDAGNEAFGNWQYLASGGRQGEEFNIEDSPAYAYQQKKIEDAINAKYASLGMLGSRAAVNSLADANANLANNEYNNQYARLGDLVNMGYGSTNALNNLRIGAASNIGNNLMQGAANYGTSMNQYGNYAAQATAAPFNTLGSLFNSGFGDYALMGPTNNLINRMSSY